MALADALAPEGIGLTVRKNGLCVDTVQGKQSRIPTHGNDSHSVSFFAGLVHIGKMLRDSCVGIKAVDNVEVLCQLRCLYRKISCASAAENQHIDLIFVRSRLGDRINLYALCLNLHGFRVSSGKYSHKLCIRILSNGKFYAAAEITITCNTNSCLHFLHSL